MGTVGVLIVEDDDSIREVLTELLEDVGYVVFIAHNGRVALERLRSHPEGLVVLLDLIMPDMDGYSLLQVIADESSLATKHACILMSATATMLPARVALLAKELKVTVLSKPFNLDEVLQEVEKAANRLA